MTKEDTKNFLRRIKQHYQEFSVDDYKINEWYNELKDYNVNDINNKFEEHLRSEQYGNDIPKIWFLTKYLKKEKEKGNKRIRLICDCCNKTFDLEEYEKHYSKCTSTKFLLKQIDKYKLKTEANYDVLMELSDEQFNSYYRSVMKIVYRKTDNELEKRILGKALFDEELEIGDVIGGQI